jgi:hypothetical protein
MGWAVARWTRGQWTALVAAVVVIVVIVVGVVMFRPRPTPFPLARMQARATFTVTDAAHAQAVAHRLTGHHRLITFVVRRPQIVGQLRFRTVATNADSGELVLFVIDNRISKPVGLIAGVAPHGADVASGWDGAYGRLAEKYPWLRSVAAVRVANGFTDPGESLSFRPMTRGPIDFTAALAPGMSPMTDPARDLSFVIAYVSDDGVWAERVPVSTTRLPASS